MLSSQCVNSKPEQSAPLGKGMSCKQTHMEQQKVTTILLKVEVEIQIIILLIRYRKYGLMDQESCVAVNI